VVPYDNGKSQQEDEHGERIGTNLGQIALEDMDPIQERMIDERRSRREFITLSNKTRLSAIRF
jgi:hypothetical protein